MNTKKVFVKFCALQALYWSFYASLPAYVTSYMLEKGMGAATLDSWVIAVTGKVEMGAKSRTRSLVTL